MILEQGRFRIFSYHFPRRLKPQNVRGHTHPANSTISRLMTGPLAPTAAILAKYPSYAGSYLYPYELFLAAAVSAVFILIPAYFVRRDAGRIRREKLAALEK